MQLYFKKAFFAVVIFSLSTYAYSQHGRTGLLGGFKIQPKAGVNMFFGDLVSESRTKYAFGVNAEREMKPYLNARFDLNFGSMGGTQTDPFSLEEIYSFSNIFISYNLGVTLRPLDLALGLYKQRLLNPYVIGQLGLLQYKTEKHIGPSAINSFINFGEKEDFGEYGFFVKDSEGAKFETGGYRVTPIFSLGGGASLYINSHVSITIEHIATQVFTDNVDLHKAWYNANTQTWVKTDSQVDFYYISTLGVTYLFNDSKWKNSPKYSRKGYLRTKSLFKFKKPSKYKRPKRRKTKRYKK
jgi:hypothetical protein